MQLLIYAISLAAAVRAQAPPPPVLLTSTQSGVDPVVPTPFSGIETLEGAIIDDGPPIEGFTGPGGNATVQANLNVASYRADLPIFNFDNLTGSIITGSITGASAAGGTGVTFTVNFTGFPSESAYGPFVYHIHALSVPPNGNCTSTLGHLDPTNRGELHACDVANPQSCQAGDLAGKHGNITGTSFVATYTDSYLSTDPGSAYFFGDKSIVIHSTNTTRLTCANFARLSAGMSSPNGTSGANGTSSGGAGNMSTSTGGSSKPSGTSPGVGATGTSTSPSVPETTTNAASLLHRDSFLAGGVLAVFAAVLL